MGHQRVHFMAPRNPHHPTQRDEAGGMALLHIPDLGESLIHSSVIFFQLIST
jgi:hypothetical protein